MNHLWLTFLYKASAVSVTISTNSTLGPLLVEHCWPLPTPRNPQLGVTHFDIQLIFMAKEKMQKKDTPQIFTGHFAVEAHSEGDSTYLNSILSRWHCIPKLRPVRQLFDALHRPIRANEQGSHSRHHLNASPRLGRVWQGPSLVRCDCMLTRKPWVQGLGFSGCATS